MITLEEIEAAVETLPHDQKHELLLFVTERLRYESAPLVDSRNGQERNITSAGMASRPAHLRSHNKSISSPGQRRFGVIIRRDHR
jgi:hypothetical protein